MTFMMRPRVSGPTGILMGDPVSNTGWPRIKPSVPSIAMVRTVFSPLVIKKTHQTCTINCLDWDKLPKCWATSRIRRGLRLLTSRAFRMGGSCSSNWTSTTAPMTATMRPLVVAAAGASALFSSLAVEKFSEIEFRWLLPLQQPGELAHNYVMLVDQSL